MKQKVQTIEKIVTAQGQVVKISEYLDKDYDKLTGIAFLDNIGTGNKLISSSLDSADLFPKNFEVLFLQTSSNVPPDKRFFTLHGKKAKGNKIEFEYQDGGTKDIRMEQEISGSYPYTLTIYLKLEDERG